MSFSRIKIGENEYTVSKLNAVDAIELSLKAASIIGHPAGDFFGKASGQEGKEDADSVLLPALGAALSAVLKDPERKEVFEVAYSRCCTPNGDSLGNPVDFDKWFKEHPGDAIELAIRATVELVKDFFPKALATKLTSSLGALGEKMKSMPSASTSQKDGRRQQ